MAELSSETKPPSIAHRGADLGEFRRGGGALFSAFTGNVASITALPFFSLPFLMGPLSQEFGWTRSAIGNAVSILTIGIFLMSPWVGRVCDRFGVRAVVLPSVALSCLCMLALSQIGPSIWLFYMAYAALAAAGSGATPVAYSRAVTGWFDRHRGIALGVIAMGSGLAAMLWPLLASSIHGAWGWRGGYMVIAAVMAVQLPLAWFLLRENPAVRPSSASAAERASRKAARAEIFRAVKFWALVGAILTMAIAGTGIIIHVAGMLGDVGMSPARIATTASLIGVGILVGRLGAGILLDYVRGPWVGVGLFLTASVGFALLIVDTAATAPFAMFMISVAMGSETDLIAYYVSRYFGKRTFAEIFGWMFGVMAVGTALGPILVGKLYDWTGGYQASFVAGVLLTLTAASLLLALGSFPRPETVDA